MIEEIALKNFRNYDEQKVRFNKGINIFCGRNGQGKTNLLEAVYFVGMLSSFRKTDIRQMIRKGEDFFSITGSFNGGGPASLSVERGHAGWKKISADGNSYRKKLEYLGKVRMVVFSPDEMELIQGSPEGRRRYLDRTFFNICHSHLKQIKNYRRILRHRNSLLKRGEFQNQELDAWSEKLAHSGAGVIRGRMEVVDVLNENLERSHPFIGTDRVSLRYAGSCSSGERGDISQEIIDQLYRLRGEEKKRRMTLAGPHRDDVEIYINGRAARFFSSRGEMRSVLLSLKVAEMELYSSRWSENPLILLDDVASELDIERRGSLISFLRDSGQQVLITTTEPENIPLLASEKEHIFRVANGKILH